MSIKSLAVVALLSTVMFSCTKEQSGITKNEPFTEVQYKSLLEGKVQLRTLDKSRTGNPTGNQLKFSSYKEAYQFFDALTKLRSDDKTVLVEASVRSQPEVTNGRTMGTTSGTDYVTYSGSISSHSSTTGTMFSSLSANYTTSITIGFAWTQLNSSPKVYGTRNWMGTDATTPIMTYSGIGSANGTATMTCYSGHGAYSGAMQGVADIMGITSSFIIAFNGTFSASMPSGTPPASITVSTTLYSQEH